MSQCGYSPMNEYNTILVTEYFLKDRGIDIPEEWLEESRDKVTPGKVLRLLNHPDPGKTKYHDIFYQKYFAKYPEELDEKMA